MILMIGITVALFALAFMTKRRFGVLGLALCAGALLAETQTGMVAGFIEGSIESRPLNSTALAASLLILLPSFMLLFGGPKYFSKKAALIGSIGYALLGSLLLLGPLSGSLSFDTSSRDVMMLIARYESAMIAAGVALAVVDMWLTHMPKLGRDKKQH